MIAMSEESAIQVHCISLRPWSVVSGIVGALLHR